MPPLVLAVQPGWHGVWVAEPALGLYARAPTPDRLPAALARHLAELWDAVVTEPIDRLADDDRDLLWALTMRFVTGGPRRPGAVTRHAFDPACAPGCLGGNACRHTPARPGT